MFRGDNTYNQINTKGALLTSWAQLRKHMNKLFYLVILILLSSCLSDKSKQSEKIKEKLTDEEKAIIRAFADFDSLLTLDNGKFWGKIIYGPIILIEPETRVFYANENNTTNSFNKVNSIYRDSLPTNINIANTAIDWDNKRWSMVMLPLPTDRISRNNLVIHELFHLIQPKIGFENLQELDNGHLDTFDGRLLLRLELQALENALTTNDHETRIKHIQNALIFRSKRQLSQEIKNAENSLELNEGLAEYTAIMLSGRNEQQMKSHLSQSKNDFYSNPTFVRSFAYQTIPYYGYLLSSKNQNWHRNIDRNTNLTDYFAQSFGVDISTEKSVEQIGKQNAYDYQQIDQEETEREKIRLKKIAKLKIKFSEKPTLELLFQNMNISFDPRNITPLENLGTVYPNLRVTDDWGILTVENGALLASDWTKVIVSAPTEVTDKTVNGDGWELELNPEWMVREVGTNFKLTKK
jgi:hypothetical protein